jgi:hypothetical protein
MIIMPKKKWLLAGMLLLVQLSQCDVIAAPDKSISKLVSQQEIPAEHTRKALEQIVTFDLVHHPLTEIVRLIQDQSGIRLVLDRPGLLKAGINPDDAIISTQLHATIGSVLHQILHQYSLDYAIIGDMVLITTESLAVNRQMQQRVQVRFDRLQLRAALDQLSRETATNLVLDQLAYRNGSHPVNLNVDDAPLEAVIKLLAHQAGLVQIRVGKVIIVTTKENARELQERDETSQPAMPTDGELDKMIHSYTHIRR